MNFYDYDLRPIEATGPELGSTDNKFVIDQVAYDIKSLFSDNQTAMIILTNPPHWGGVEQLSNTGIDYVVYNSSDHPDKVENRHLYDISTKPVIKLHSEFDSEYYYPFWFMASRHCTSSYPDLTSIDTLKQHYVEYLCGKTRVSRIYVALSLANRNYFNRIKINWCMLKFTDSVNEFIDTLVTHNHSSVRFEFPDFTAGVERFIGLHKDFTPLPLSIDGYAKVFSAKHGLSDAYLQIVSESVPEHNSKFVSEKIWKPLRAGQLFLIQGGPGTIGLLRQAGFDVFDDYIDHARYDNEPDWQTRTDLMLSVLDDIYSNIETIYFSTTARRQANIDRFNSQDLVDWALRNVTAQIHNLAK